MKISKIQDNFNIRYNFGKYHRHFQIPNLIDIQKKSYAKFMQEYIDPKQRVQTGLQSVLTSIFPIRNYNNVSTLEFLEYVIDRPKYTPDECKDRGIVYSSSLRVKMKLTVNSKQKKFKKSLNNILISEKYIYYGEVPRMTNLGTFIINGTERVIVSQLHRSPGVFFEKSDLKISGSNVNLYSGRIIPYRGSWIDFEFDSKDILYCRIDRRRKFHVSILLKALGYETKDLLSIFYNIETLNIKKNTFFKQIILKNYLNKKVDFNLFDLNENLILEENNILTRGILEKFNGIINNNIKIENEKIQFLYSARDMICPITNSTILNVNDPITLSKINDIKKGGVFSIKVITILSNSDNIIRSTLSLDETNSQESAISEIYRKIRPGEMPALAIAEDLLYNLFFNIRRYDLSEVGRLKINHKLGLNTPLENKVLTHNDLIYVIKYLLNLRNGKGSIDDIDHLGNRRVRSVGELVENQYQIGLVRMAKSIREKMSIKESELLSPNDLINCKPLTAVIKEFFGSSQLSQFMDQTNPLSEITHKRRLSALGPGGLTKDRAGFKVRDIHLTHYGRICPIETPEGPNIGLIASLASFARINKYGFIETPYIPVSKGEVSKHIVYHSALKEGSEVIAQANSALDITSSTLVQARVKGETVFTLSKNITLMDVSPNQLISIAAGLIPFLEHDDANRALMGSNMQRQAVPLLFSESPLVGTGMEDIFSRDSGPCQVAKMDGIVSYVDNSRILIKSIYSQNFAEKEYIIDIYRLKKYQRTNQDTCASQRSIVSTNDVISKGDILADGTSMQNGELALGKNVVVAFMPWHGYNFEDSILISEKLIKEDLYTSIHIQEYELMARDTKLGSEEITKDIPNVGDNILEKLDDSGIIKVGMFVQSGDILVGKVTPKGEIQLSPEEKLIKAIFGDRAGNVQDTSLRMPPGGSGIVIKTRVFHNKSFKNVSQNHTEESNEKEIIDNRNIEIKIIIQSYANEIHKTVSKFRLSVDFSTDSLFINKDQFISKNFFGKISWGNYLKLKFYDENINKFVNQYVNRMTNDIKTTYRGFQKKIIHLHEPEELPHGTINLIRVSVAISRRLQPGDKMAGRHGNKGVISKVLPEEDMPYLSNGMSIDIVLNPLGVPSRMNVGQVLEMYLGWAMKITGEKITHLFYEKKYDETKKFLSKILYNKGYERFNENISFNDLRKIISNVRKGLKVASPVFDGATESHVKDLLSLNEQQSNGQTILFDGRSGSCFDQNISVGIMYMLKLHHLVDEKLHARSVGPYSLITQQPLGGKAQFGGQRLGEMEVWALEGYGAAYALQEFLTVKSDDVNGRTKMYESIIKGEHTLESSVPESFNVLMKELQSLGLDIQLFEDVNNSIKDII